MKVDAKSIDLKAKNLRQPKENSIETRLIWLVKWKKGACIKFTSHGQNGMPDRICLLPGGRIWFVELKRQNKKPDPLQMIMHEALSKLGFKVRVISTIEQLKQFENEISAL